LCRTSAGYTLTALGIGTGPVAPDGRAAVTVPATPRRRTVRAGSGFYPRWQLPLTRFTGDRFPLREHQEGRYVPQHFMRRHEMLWSPPEPRKVSQDGARPPESRCVRDRGRARSWIWVSKKATSRQFVHSGDRFLALSASFSVYCFQKLDTCGVFGH
jgi:hypothetical protein